jgi:hypothetical protein
VGYPPKKVNHVHVSREALQFLNSKLIKNFDENFIHNLPVFHGEKCSG